MAAPRLARGIRCGPNQNAHFINDSTLVVFDNGNTRRASDPNADSRGQVWTLDEKKLTANLVFNADLGNYSDALGAAQPLPNGNYVFTSGRQGQPPNFFGQSIEVRPDGTKAYVLEVNRSLYRSFRVRTLYEGTDTQPDGGEDTPQATTHDRTGHGRSPLAVENSTGAGLLDLGVLVGVTGQVQPTGIDTLAFSTPGFEEASPLARFTSTAAVQGSVRNQALRSLAAPLPALSSRVRGGAHDHIFADFDCDWLSDALLTNLALVG